ncbi:ABC-type branched-subunit amino acid transport system substrate-binding protein [Bradyrhizobium sp. USDA 326]
MKLAAALIGLSLLTLATGSAHAEGSDEIRIGQTLPYSGPASGFGAIGRTQEAFFEKINAEGGINGRKVKFITLDDAYSPPKTVEQTRKLVEQDEVLMLFGSLGTATNSAVHRYLNGKKVPQLFVLSGATKWADPQKYPWTMPGMAAYESEGVVYAKHVLRTKPGAKIAILSQNDDFGRDYVAGFKRALGNKAAGMIVAEATYETSAPTISSQLSTLKASGADVLFGVVLGKFTSQIIRRRDRLEARAVLRADLGLVDLVPGAGGARQCHRPDLVEQQGHDGPAMGQRSRREGVLRLHEAIHAERGPLQLELRGRLPLRDAAHDRAEGVQG